MEALKMIAIILVTLLFMNMAAYFFFRKGLTLQILKYFSAGLGIAAYSGFEIGSSGFTLFSSLVVPCVGAIIVMGVVFALNNKISKPVFQLRENLREISQGGGDLTYRIQINTGNELDEVVALFNEFLDLLSGMILGIKNSLDKLTGISIKLNGSAEGLSTGAIQQQDQLSEVASSIGEMSAMILETSENTGHTQRNANSANIAAVEGTETVDQTIEGMEEIAGIVETSSSQIRALKTRSEEIADVIQVIDDISDQTNLLALNANIEAARAGESGRGFAVVADEVRKLAERTVDATADIRAKVSKIQADVKASVVAMERITEKSLLGQALAEDAGSALGNISRSIDSVNTAISHIASATAEQSSGVDQISKSVEVISSVSRKSAADSQDLVDNTLQMRAVLKDLADQINHFIVK